MFSVTDYYHKRSSVELEKCYDLTSDFPSRSSDFIVSCESLLRLSDVYITLNMFFPLSHPYSFKNSCQNRWMFPCGARPLPGHGDMVWVHWAEKFVVTRPLCEEEAETNPSSTRQLHGAEFLPAQKTLTETGILDFFLSKQLLCRKDAIRI